MDKQNRKCAGKKFVCFVWFALLFTVSTTAALSQRLVKSIDKTQSLPNAQTSDDEDENFIKPSRPTISNPAEFQKSGVLQIEYGYDGNFRSDEFRSQQSAPLEIRFAASERVLFDVSLDTVVSEVDEMRKRENGVGDTSGITVGVADFFKKR